MSHEIHRVTNLEAVAPFTLRVAFEDGTAQVIDFSPVLHGELYAPLRIGLCSIGFGLIQRRIPSCGRTVLILTRPFCTIGQWRALNWRSWRNRGSYRRRVKDGTNGHITSRWSRRRPTYLDEGAAAQTKR